VDRVGEAGTNVVPSLDEYDVGVGEGGTSRETRSVPADGGESAEENVGTRRELGEFWEVMSESEGGWCTFITGVVII
jgi:hypothetical protein